MASMALMRVSMRSKALPLPIVFAMRSKALPLPIVFAIRLKARQGAVRLGRNFFCKPHQQLNWDLAIFCRPGLKSK